jgi:predicted nuclease with TOPRIM domain
MLWRSGGGGGSNQMLYDEMQNEIEQLKNEKTQLQMSLSAAELTISSLKEKEEEYQQEVSGRDDEEGTSGE